ncbi:hypothetical protein EV356DRAFT_510992 [Viridothelium virens]|uniref:Uncharacterized protein n=1 Tax=Viridothelium virens TaxID=1048519 RepID=A0A6A6GU91_VIRVR|nr:hypothetical protein EV356DRAFT_510992 [Viridothelium virens]
MLRIQPRCNFRASFFQLPSELRTTYLLRSRLFHASPHRRTESLEVFTFAASQLNFLSKFIPYGLLETVHYTTGLSWGFAIPAVAILLRTFVVYPLVTLPIRRAEQKRIDLRPLEQAYGEAIRRKYVVENAQREENQQRQLKRGVDEENVKDRPWEHKELEKAAKGSADNYSERLREKFSCEEWRTNLWVWQAGLFWMMGEAISSMAGYKPSLLRTCYEPWTRLKEIRIGKAPMKSTAAIPALADAGTPTTESPTMSTFSRTGPPDYSAEDALEEANEHPVMQTFQRTPANNATTVPAAQESHDLDPEYATGSLFTPSLADEGLLWFPDLASPDPLAFLLPIVAGLTAARVWYLLRYERSGRSEALGDHRRDKSLIEKERKHRIIGPFWVWWFLAITAQSLPAGFLLYWGSSTGWALLQGIYIGWKHPWRKAPKACTRVIKYQV